MVATTTAAHANAVSTSLPSYLLSTHPGTMKTETIIKISLLGFVLVDALRPFGPGQLKLGLEDGLTSQLSMPLEDAYASLPVVLWHGMGTPLSKVRLDREPNQS